MQNFEITNIDYGNKINFIVQILCMYVDLLKFHTKRCCITLCYGGFARAASYSKFGFGLLSNVADV